MIRNINFLFVTFFGIGTIRYAPGTITSLVTTVLLFSSFHILDLSKTAILIILITIFLYSFLAIANYIKGDSNKDPKEVVIDEFIGQSIPIYLYEISHGTEKSFEDSFYFYVIMFMAFRVFDIIKPFPVSYFDKNFKNSFGVIMDDIVAGLYVVLFLIFFMTIKVYFTI